MDETRVGSVPAGARPVSARVRFESNRAVGTRREWHGVAAVALVYAILCSVLGYCEPFWRDEIQTLRATDQGVFHAVQRALSFELQPPLYFALEALWRVAFPTPHAARIPSALFGAASIVVGAALAARLLPRVRPAWAALLLASSPHVIWAGTEARVYALTMLMATATVLLVVRVHLEGCKRARPGLVILAILSLYTHYYSSFILAAGGVLLVLLRRWREALAYGLEMLVVVAAFLPLAHVVSTHAQAMATVSDWSSRSLPWELETTTIQQFVGRWDVRTAAPAFRALRWSIRVLALVSVAKLVWMRRKGISISPAVATLAAFSILSFLVGKLVTVQAGAPFVFRYQIGHTIPALLLPVALALPLGRFSVHGVLAFLVALNGWAAYEEHRSLGRSGDSEAAARFLEQHGQADEPIVITPADAIHDLAFYYRGPGRLVAAPKEPSNEAYRELELRVQSPDDLIGALKRTGNPSTFWLYTVEERRDGLFGSWLSPVWEKTAAVVIAGGRLGSGELGEAHVSRFRKREAGTGRTWVPMSACWTIAISDSTAMDADVARPPEPICRQPAP